MYSAYVAFSWQEDKNEEINQIIGCTLKRRYSSDFTKKCAALLKVSLCAIFCVHPCVGGF